MMRKLLFLIAVVLGLAIAYVDSRPTWDDSGVTAAAILAACGLLGLLSPPKPWLWALSVGGWIPLAAVFFSHNYGGFLALLFAFAGAYGGAFLRLVFDKLFHPA
jgi:hypothetical protein